MVSLKHKKSGAKCHLTTLIFKVIFDDETGPREPSNGERNGQEEEEGTVVDY